jgi:hypothetical protein
MDTVQASLSTAVMQTAMNFQGNMAAAVINGTSMNPNQGPDAAQQAARAAGLAAEGVGTKLNVQA